MHTQLVQSTDTAYEQKQDNSGRRKLFFWTIYLVSFALLAWFVIDGYSYYITPYSQRAHQPEFRVLKPAGTRGLAFAYAGAGMMVLMLVYSIRKRSKLLGRKVSMQSLLHFHIYLGIMGPLLIILHTSFKVQGLVAVSFWSMIAVAASGFFGRYLYLQIPRNIQGTELTLQEMERMNQQMTEKLRTRFQLDEASVAKLQKMTDRYATGFKGGAFTAVILLLANDVFRFWARGRFIHRLRIALPLPGREMKNFGRLAFKRANLQRRITLLAQIQQVFHYWHVIHKPFAIIMYLIMLVHIGVAVWTGYGWVW